MTLVCLFAYSGLNKLTPSARASLKQVTARILPSGVAGRVALVLGPLEIALSLALLLSRGARLSAALWASTGLMIIMSLVVYRLLQLPGRSTCRCFGVSASPVSRLDLVRNIALALWAGVTASFAPHIEVPFGTYLVVLVPAAALVLLLSSLSEVQELFAGPRG
jgi:hypothetical protein